jgi:LCP family protein required for cell wall assembly
MFFRNSNQLQSASFQKIDSLIQEIGDLKQENLYLNQQVNQQAGENKVNNQTLQSLYLKFIDQTDANNKITSLKTGLQSYQQKLAEEQQKNQQQNSDLSNQLNQKDLQISTLREKKQLDTSFTDINDKTFSVLFIGENMQLTDSIMLAVVDPDKQKTTLISIPRDLFYNGRKINEYYEFFGADKLIEVIKDVSGIKADKYIVFDFQSFVDTINSLGGVDINVDKAFTDNQYPTPSKGYKVVSFKQGLQTMDGERALEYARSRKSTSDFDRSLRQQNIVTSIKQKLQTRDVIKNIDFYLTAYKNVSQDLKTDFNIFEAIQLYDQYKNYSLYAGNILSNQNFLYSSRSMTGQSILLPKNGTYTAFQQKVLEII